MPGLLGKKIGMTSVFSAEGKIIRKENRNDFRFQCRG